MSHTPPAGPSPASNPPSRKSGAGRTLAILAAVVVVIGGALGATWMAIAADDNHPAAKVPAPAPLDPVAVEAGRKLTLARGCVTCHSDDGSPNRGPTYKGLYGSTVTYTDGTTGVIDDAEVREALAKPAAKVIAPFEPLMPPAKMTEDETKQLIAYLKSIGAGR